MLSLGFSLFIFSGVASAGFPTTPVSQDFDIGTLTSTHFATHFANDSNFLRNSYTFDLASESRVDAWLLNSRWETGNIFTGIPPLTIMTYGLIIFDSNNKILFNGETTGKWDFGSTRSVHVTGVLPAGENYYVGVGGQQLNDVGLDYRIDMVATSVPEPETYAMFLAGLGLLGWRLRKPNY